MSERTFDVVVIGAGPAGEVCAGRLGQSGLQVAVGDAEHHAARADAPGDAVVAAYAAAVAAAALEPSGFEAERARQSGVLAALLGL